MEMTISNMNGTIYLTLETLAEDAQEPWVASLSVTENQATTQIMLTRGQLADLQCAILAIGRRKSMQTTIVQNEKR